MLRTLLYCLSLVFLMSFGISAIPGLTNNTKLTTHQLFNTIEIGIPEVAPRVSMNKESDEKQGFAYFKSSDETVDITLTKKEKLDLEKIKHIEEGMAIDFYKGKAFRSEIIKVNGRDIYVCEVKGRWNGEGETIGMFRYYFNANGNSYNLLMRYPAAEISKTKELKTKMLESIKVIK